MTLDTTERAGTVPAAAHRWRWIGLAALLTAEAMNLLDSTIVQVAAPVMGADLGGPRAEIPWFSAAYTLAFALLLITGGRLGDIAGRRRVFRAGVAVFGLASLCCALAPGPGVLIAARAVQGAAAAAIIPQTFGLIRAMFSGREQATALGTIGPVMGLAAVCGPVLGGVLTHANLFGSSWRSVFLVNLPLVVAVLTAAPALREDRAPRRPHLDPAGTALAAVGTGLLVYPLIAGGSAHRPVWTWPMLAAGLAVLVLFALRQRRGGRDPRPGRDMLLEPGLFTDRGFPSALVVSTLLFAVINGLMLAVVLHLQLGLGADALTSGLTLLSWSGILAVASLVAARLVHRHGRRMLFAGLGTMLAGVLGAVVAYRAGDPASYPWPLLAALAVTGAGQAMVTVPFFTMALGRVRPQETGSAAGLLNAVQMLGGTLGVALLGGAFLHAAAGHPGPAGALSGVTTACLLAVALLAAAVPAAVLMTRARA